jgi:lipid-binding SYLF domain-containing protein
MSISKFFGSLVVLSLIYITSLPAYAASAEEIDIKVNHALERFRSDVDIADNFLDMAKGVLVFPEVIKAGFVLGGEYGEGALRIGGQTADYYNTASASFGFQMGAQLKTIIIIFLEQEALDKFRNSSNWEAGVDGSVALIEFGAGKEITTTSIDEPIIGFIFNNKGLMYNLTLEGTKITKINK